jgi:hypothetical protein
MLVEPGRSVFARLCGVRKLDAPSALLGDAAVVVVAAAAAAAATLGAAIWADIWLSIASEIRGF